MQIYTPLGSGEGPTQLRADDLQKTNASPEALPQLSKTPSLALPTQQALLSHAIAEGEAHSTTTFSGAIATSLAAGSNGSFCSPLLACYASWLGRRDQNHRVSDAGRELYIHGLEETKRALRGKETVYADATLAACNMLGIFEAIECPEETMTGYQWHRAACYRLVYLRGAEAHREGAAHHLFVNFRIFGVSSALLLACWWLAAYRIVGTPRT